MTSYFPILFGGMERPSLDLNFAALRQLDPRITFTRASAGTYVGAPGLILTAATDIPRFTHDPITGQSLGLLIEEARTNLLLRSSEFGTAPWNGGSVASDVATAPDGAMTGDRITLATVGTTHLSQVTATVVAGSVYTASVYVRNASAGLALRLSRWGATAFESSEVAIPTGPGWQRVEVSRTYVAEHSGPRFDIINNAGGTGATVEVWGAQVEAGAFATSYIPTTAATTTRAADLATVEGAAFASWWNPSEGTALVDFQGVANVGGFTRIAAQFYGAALHLALLGYNATNATRFYVESGTAQADVTVAAAIGQRLKLAAALRANEFNQATGGVLGAGDLAGSVPVISALALGRNGQNGDARTFLNGTIGRLRYWRRRLPDATLQALTA